MATPFKLAALFLPSVAQAAQIQGTDVHCVGRRAHALHYDVEGEANDGESLEGVRSAQIMVQPMPDLDSKCTHGRFHLDNKSKELCYGVNEDPSCNTAKSVLPLEDGLDCKDCFLGAKAGLFYTLNYTIPKVNSVAVGFHGMNLKGALEAHTSPEFSKRVLKGQKVLRDAKKTTVINRLVGCPVCVKVQVSVAMPTSLNYSLTLNDGADLVAGATLDVDLGDHYLSWDQNIGWSKVATNRSVSVAPAFTGSMAVEADLELSVASSLQIDVDKLLWYHMDMAQSLPMQLKLHEKLPSKKPSVCTTGSMDFSLSHEADLHVSLFGKTHQIHHWGPAQDFSDSKPFQKCGDVPVDNVPVVV